MDSRDHVERVEAAKLAREQEREGERLGHVDEHADLIDRAYADVMAAHAQAAHDFGRATHGVSVNQPLTDYYRELDEAQRALANARNALRVMRDPQVAQAVPHGRP